MTQKQLADVAGVSRQTIISIESDKYSPSLELAFRLANVFDKSLEEVFSCEMTQVPEKPKKKRKNEDNSKVSATK